jgi:rhamnulokinase
VIDPNDASFLNPVDMPETIAAFCRATGQTPPDVRALGEVMRCVLGVWLWPIARRWSAPTR